MVSESAREAAAAVREDVEFLELVAHAPRADRSKARAAFAVFGFGFVVVVLSVVVGVLVLVFAADSWSVAVPAFIGATVAAVGMLDLYRGWRSRAALAAYARAQTAVRVAHIEISGLLFCETLRDARIGAEEDDEYVATRYLLLLERALGALDDVGEPEIADRLAQAIPASVVRAARRPFPRIIGTA